MVKNNKMYLLPFLWTFLIMAILYFVASMPGGADADSSPISLIFTWFSPAVHNILHVPAYAILAWAMYRSLLSYFSFWVLSLVVVLLVSGYGAFLEWHQLMVPGRFASFTDVLFNFIGSVIGVFFSTKYVRLASVDSSYQ
ncbi:MAG: VanZ family protein [Nitrosomonas sp.]|nr:VanZ family protein [Nitrosomonas sp.]